MLVSQIQRSVLSHAKDLWKSISSSYEERRTEARDTHQSMTVACQEIQQVRLIHYILVSLNCDSQKIIGVFLSNNIALIDVKFHAFCMTINLGVWTSRWSMWFAFTKATISVTEAESLGWSRRFTRWWLSDEIWGAREWWRRKSVAWPCLDFITQIFSFNFRVAFTLSLYLCFFSVQ